MLELELEILFKGQRCNIILLIYIKLVLSLTFGRNIPFAIYYYHQN